jgi:ribosomal protein S2
MEKTKNRETGNNGVIDALFAAGAHFGFVKSRRHPSAKPFIFGAKNKIEIFDLEKTSKELAKALAFVEAQGKAGATALIVGGKSEAREAVKSAGSLICLMWPDAGSEALLPTSQRSRRGSCASRS